MQKRQVTTIKEIKKVLAGEMISLPPFAPGTEFTARLRRVSIAAMVKAGKIPNPLLQKVYELFQDKIFTKRLATGQVDENKDELKQLMTFIDTVVSEALIEPSVAELAKEGITLTDEQKNAIFQYIQEGAVALSNFRNEQRSDADIDDVENIQASTKPIYESE